MLQLTITDRFVYSLINSYTINHKPFYGSNSYLAKELNKSISVISHSISRLLKLGYLENKGNKFVRELYTKNNLFTVKPILENAENSISNADFNIRNAENSILLDDLKAVLVKISTFKMLKSAIENAENSNILLSILLSYTNNEKEKSYKKEKVCLNNFSLKVFSENEIFELKKKYPNVNLEVMADVLVNYCKAKGRIYKDYKAAFRNFCQKEQEKFNNNQLGKLYETNRTSSKISYAKPSLGDEIEAGIARLSAELASGEFKI